MPPLDPISLGPGEVGALWVPVCAGLRPAREALLYVSVRARGPRGARLRKRRAPAASERMKLGFQVFALLGGHLVWGGGVRVAFENPREVEGRRARAGALGAGGRRRERSPPYLTLPVTNSAIASAFGTSVPTSISSSRVWNPDPRGPSPSIDGIAIAAVVLASDPPPSMGASPSPSPTARAQAAYSR